MRFASTDPYSGVIQYQWAVEKRDDDFFVIESSPTLWGTTRIGPIPSHRLALKVVDERKACLQQNFDRLMKRRPIPTP